MNDRFIVVVVPEDQAVSPWLRYFADSVCPTFNEAIDLINESGMDLEESVYLAGGINGLSDSDAKDWREYAKQRLIYRTLDPMRRDYRGKEDESVDEIVHGDLEDIDLCRIILASCLRPSWGTAMELHYGAITPAPVPNRCAGVLADDITEPDGWTPNRTWADEVAKHERLYGKAQ